MKIKTLYPHLLLLFILGTAIVSLFFYLTSITAFAENESIDQGLAAIKLKIDLSSEEKQWLKNHPTIKIAGPRSFPPFHYYDDDGALKGMSVDYILFILKALGVRPEIQSDFPWPTVLKKAQQREIDLISCSAQVADREAYLAFSHAYLSFPLVITTRSDAPFIGGINDLHGKKVAFIHQEATIEWLRKDNINTIPYFVKSPLESLEAVSFGYADANIQNLAVVSYLIQKNGLTNVKIAAPTPYGNYNLHMAVRSDWPELLTIINKSLDAISPEKHTAIRNKWLSVRYEYGIQVKDILKWVFLVTLIAAIILTIIVIWNRRLQKEIVERKLAEKASQENRERYTALFERSLDALYINDFEGNFLDANQAGLDLLGYSRDEIDTTNYASLLEKDSLSVASESTAHLIETGFQKKPIEMKLKTKSGEYVWVETVGSLLYKDGTPFAVQGIARDITEMKRTAEERENLISDLKEALDNIKTLTGLIPICANCKKIRDDKGYWNQLETFIEKHSEALFSHGVCPDCAEELYGDTKWFQNRQKDSKL